MDLPQKLPLSMVLRRVADHLHDHHNDLTVALSTSHVTYEEALSAAIECARELPDRILLPTTNPARREALRIQAIENKRLLDDAILLPGRLTSTTGKLNPEDCPKSPSPGSRAILNDNLWDEIDSPPH
ncbi:hypothetical protein P168DRAFT_154289 [Aspergillus campestris IBT 28561]|uniref:Uncharacterized protein n=1 Tax=Aspergillus campestris (strain IBT 28561) TaxID=1392248 RepID=A0A2I1D2Z2_ASPC2|nr:uncharacterized protein P168DRAFT_154289 [Aspergillus campestris IBT 28561]PKY04218.1 hypothetical protein P168DRAFT_154289 [Aspergillus campestris IBT 28561]